MNLQPAATARRRAAKTGFTLVELLVVIAIIGVLVALLLPAVQAAREAARRADCQSKLHNLGLAVLNFESARGKLPTNYGTGNAYADKASHSWIMLTLPYFEQQSLYGSIDQKAGFQFPGQGNSIAAETAIPSLLCTADDSNNGGKVDERADSIYTANTKSVPYGVTNYKACAGSNWNYTPFFHRERVGRNSTSTFSPPKTPNTAADGVDHPNGWTSRNLGVKNPLKLKEITDGTTRTFAIGECVVSASRWSSWYWHNNTSGTCAIPLNYPMLSDPEYDLDPNFEKFKFNYSFHSRHVGGGQFCMFDGSVRFISQDISLDVYKALATVSVEDSVSESDL